MIWGLLAALAFVVGIGWWFGRARRPVVPPIVVDGSNVMHWGGQGPSFEVLLLVLKDLRARGFAPVVYFDANVGYKVVGRHMSVREIATELGMRDVIVVPAGEPADPHLIAHADRVGARIVSNDRFMDWRGAYPVLRRKGVLVKGRIVGARVELRMLARA